MCKLCESEGGPGPCRHWAPVSVPHDRMRDHFERFFALRKKRKAAAPQEKKAKKRVQKNAVKEEERMRKEEEEAKAAALVGASSRDVNEGVNLSSFFQMWRGGEDEALLIISMLQSNTATSVQYLTQSSRSSQLPAAL